MRIFLISWLMLFSGNAFCQKNHDTTTTRNSPGFPGGQEAMVRFIQGHLNYPQEARDHGIQGRVVVSFIVEKDGSIKSENIRVEVSVHALLDAEAVRVIKLMPNWIPARYNGKEIRAKTGVPIVFSM